MGYRIPLRHSAPYCAAKAGLVQLTKQMAKELSGQHVLIAVAPSSIEGSDMIDQVRDSMIRIRGMDSNAAAIRTC